MAIIYPIGPAGHTTDIYLPDDWYSRSPADQRAWIAQSDLTEADADQLESELGLDNEDVAAVNQAGAAGWDTTIKTTRALTQAIAASQSGSVSFPKNSSAAIIAKNNSWSFSVQLDPLNPNNVNISSSSFGSILTGGGIGLAIGAIVLIVLLMRD